MGPSPTRVYLGLPLEVRRLTGGESGVVALFVISYDHPHVSVF